MLLHPKRSPRSGPQLSAFVFLSSISASITNQEVRAKPHIRAHEIVYLLGRLLISVAIVTDTLDLLYLILRYLILIPPSCFMRSHFSGEWMAV